MMSRAVALARRGEGRVEPNPMVGCVIVRDRRIIGEGYHRRFGGPHAEVEALRACKTSPRGATAYVSLEPCCHFGKTPPCTEALIRAKIARVVVAVPDPNPVVGGKGLSALKRAGIQVESGVGAEGARRLLAPYLTRLKLNRPYVILKWAQSIDGKLATHTGDSKWITGPAARREAHRLRARVDAVLVGSGTARADDPLLTARDVPIRRQATRIVLDTALTLDPGSQLVQTAQSTPTWVFTSAAAMKQPQAAKLRSAGVELISTRTARGKLSLRTVLRTLATRGMTNVMVEGGAEVLSAFLRLELADEAWIFVAPRLLGGRDAPAVLADDGVAKVGQAVAPRASTVRRLGDDTHWHLQLTDPPV
jgi:diaminohydroxyphosphoribosylaminopyrimidine deaminase/5-amino-6-(5-phosphoribosylamino)uracil reductase